MKKLFAFILLVGIMLCGCSNNNEQDYFKSKNTMVEDDYLYIIENLNGDLYKDTDIEIKYTYKNSDLSTSKVSKASIQRCTDNNNIVITVESESDKLVLISNDKEAFIRVNNNEFTRVKDKEFFLASLLVETLHINRDLSALINNEKISCEFTGNTTLNDIDYGIVTVDAVYEEEDGYKFYRTLDGNVVQLTDKEFESYKYEDKDGNIKKLNEDDMIVNSYDCIINSQTGFIDIISGLNKAHGYEYTMSISREATYEHVDFDIAEEQMEFNEAIDLICAIVN